MKLHVIGLIAVGVIAALCVAVLVGALQAKGRDGEGSSGPTERMIVVAARDLEPAMLVEADAVAMKRVRIVDAPKECLFDPVQVVGKVLNTPIVEGQPFTRSAFARDGSGLHLAAALPQGMRAMGVPLSESSGLQGLLYPGSIVDVLASYKPTAGSRECVSQTILQGIRVLGVEDHTIVAPEGTKDSMARTVSRGREVVTLMVNPQQAEVLQAAMEQGSISLALRHPMDTATQPEPEAVAVLVETPAPEPEPAPPPPPPAVEPEPKPESFTTWEVNGENRHSVTYVKVGDHWLRQD